MKKFIGEFKEFISRGSVMDMAVGVIIGGAFGNIVTSLVNDILMPLIGVVVGGVDFSTLAWKFGKTINEAGEEVVKVTVNYGNFIQMVVNFLIIAFCVFLVVRLFNRFKSNMEKLDKKLRKEEEEKAVEAPVIPDDVKLLTEIRDLLKKQK